MSIQLKYFDTINPNKKLAVICFDNEKSLNAQTTQMVATISEALSQWQNDDSIAAILMRGAGDKAYCAGGDIRGLYQATNQMQPTNEIKPAEALSVDARVAQFFDIEYRLMYQLHTYAKPVVSWGSGIVMGGGMGLFAASSHKVVTDSTVMAMPEVSIGLFPDAGGSYFLNRMMGKVGLFLGLTGAKWTAADARFLGLADCVMAKDDFDQLVNALTQLHFLDNAHNHGLINQALSDLHQPQLAGDSQILANFDTIAKLMNAGTLQQVDDALNAYQESSPWLQAAIATYRAGCPTTKALTWRIYHLVATWSLKDILKLEYNVATACCYYGDFAEGVRALLIDKDKTPKWRYQLDNLPVGYIDAHIGSPRTKPHRFDDL